MKIFLKIGLVIFISVLNINCNTEPKKTEPQTGKVYVVSPAEFKEKSQNQAIVDIRTPQEYKQGHLKNAVNINLFDRAFSEEVNKLDKSKPIFIYCRSGNRSLSASKKMMNLGFEQVYDLKGGISNWVKAKNEIEK